MTTTTAEELRTKLIGAWTLESYESCALEGSDVTYPLGVDARGVIMYTPDGYMSAQLMRSDRTPFDRDDPHHAPDDELAATAGGYMSYAGPFSVVDDGLIAHHVEVSLLPNWIGGSNTARPTCGTATWNSARPNRLCSTVCRATPGWCGGAADGELPMA